MLQLPSKMFNSDTYLIFPPKAIQALKDERGESWHQVALLAATASPDHLDRLSFILMMARLNNCVTCNSDSYRAIIGCTACSKQTLKRFRGSDMDLLSIFEASRIEVTSCLKNKI